MGMYDTIRCEYPLPNPKHNELEFQTKDLECCLDHYRISKEGRLIEETVRYELVPEEERPFYGRPNFKDSFLRFAGMMRPIPTGDVDREYHGDIRVYDIIEETDEWVEYKIRFTEGTVSKIERLECSPRLDSGVTE